MGEEGEEDAVKAMQRNIAMARIHRVMEIVGRYIDGREALLGMQT